MFSIFFRFGNLLEWFICHFQRERNFQSHQNNDMFISIYKEIIKNKQILMLVILKLQRKFQ